MRKFPTRAGERSPDRHQRAFTLFEILVVLAILGLLAGLAITNVDKIFGGAQSDSARLFVNQGVKSALTAYRVHLGGYPSTSEGLEALINPPAGKSLRWNGPYIEGSRIPLDPWGEPYQYESPGKINKGSYDIWSKGPDKQSGTEDDIGNWEPTAGSDKK